MTNNHRNTAEATEGLFPDLTKDRNFGVWRYHADERILTFGLAHRHDYEIELGKISTSAEMLDWLYHIAEKSWATPAVVHDLVLAFYEIFGRFGMKSADRAN